MNKLSDSLDFYHEVLLNDQEKEWFIGQRHRNLVYVKVGSLVLLSAHRWTARQPTATDVSSVVA
jgi:hypothetical protein